MDMKNFDSLDQNVGGGEVKDEAKRQEKKAKSEAMKAVFVKAYNDDKTIVDRAEAASAGLAVLKTLGYGDDGGLIRDEDTGKIVNVSAIVGYLLKNVGTTPVEYVTEEFKNVDGQWVGERVTRIAKPGEEFVLSKKNLTILASRTEYSLKLANGVVKKTSKQNKSNTLEGELTAYAFKFDDEKIKVNDDAIKMNISKKTKGADGKDFWKIDGKYEPTFGFLYNAKDAKGKGRKKESKPAVQQRLVEAVFIQSLIEDAGL